MNPTIDFRMNHYHAIIAREDGAKPNQRVTFEAGTLKEATELFAEEFGKEAVLKVWQDYFENNSLGYRE